MKTLKSTQHDLFVIEANLLRVAVCIDDKIFIGSLVDTHLHVMEAAHRMVGDDMCGFVDTDDNYMTREEAADWLKVHAFDVWRNLSNKQRLESIDYGCAAYIPRKGIELPDVGKAPAWTLNVSVQSIANLHAAPGAKQETITCSCGLEYDIEQVMLFESMCGMKPQCQCGKTVR